MKFSMKLLAQITLAIFAVLFISFGIYFIIGFYKGFENAQGTVNQDITAFVALLFVSFALVMLMVIGIYFIFVGVFELITIFILAKTKNRGVITVLGILILVFGGILPGLFMLLIKEENPVKEQDLLR